MNIYLWVASDRCWGEDSRILQFDEGNNLNRLMRNILPNSCLPCAIATQPPFQQSSSTHHLLVPKCTKFIRVWRPKGWRCPTLAFLHPEWRQATGKGPWPLGTRNRVGESAISAGLSHSAVTAQPKWGERWCGRARLGRAWPVPAPSTRMGLATDTIAPCFPSTAVFSSQDSLQSPWAGAPCYRPCPCLLLILSPPPKMISTQQRSPKHREAGLA